MTTRELSSALGTLGYDVPLVVLCSWKRRNLKRIAGWSQDLLRPTHRRGKPRKFPEEIRPFRRVKHRPRNLVTISRVGTWSEPENEPLFDGITHLRLRAECEPDYDLVIQERETDWKDLRVESKQEVPQIIEPPRRRVREELAETAMKGEIRRRKPRSKR